MKTEAEMLKTMAKYCSLAERCIFDVQKKIKAAKLTDDASKRIIERLIKEKFIDEKRFCHSFVNDKFKFNRWGRIKICYELKMKNIKPETYNDAINEINESDYENVLSDLLKEKKRSIKDSSPQDTFQKLYRFAASRGFENQLIIKSIKQNIKDNIDYDTDI